MIGLDLVGLAITVLMAGPLIFPQLIAAALIQEVGRLVVALAAGGHVEAVMAGGLFGRTTVTGTPAAVALLSGPAILLVIGALSWGGRGPRASDLWLPWAKTPRPFAAACCRLASLSLIQCLWALIVGGTVP